MLKVLAVVYPTHPLIIQLTCKEILRGRTNKLSIHKIPFCLLLYLLIPASGKYISPFVLSDRPIAVLKVSVPLPCGKILLPP